jgi:hypothetical protein
VEDMLCLTLFYVKGEERGMVMASNFEGKETVEEFIPHHSLQTGSHIVTTSPPHRHHQQHYKQEEEVGERQKDNEMRIASNFLNIGKER